MRRLIPNVYREHRERPLNGFEIGFEISRKSNRIFLQTTDEHPPFSLSGTGPARFAKVKVEWV